LGRWSRTALASAAAALCAAAVAGCGLGSGSTPGGTRLLVTTDFGTRPLVQSDTPETGGSDTVMRLLQRNTKGVKTRYGGGFVQEIDGVRGGERNGRPFDWFYYINGVQADKGAAATKVQAGDRVWWDNHEWGATSNVPAVVGQFPEPFVHGIGGKRLPVRVECVQVDSPECDQVYRRLLDLKIPAARGGVAKSFVKETLRVVVGPWPAIHEDDTAGLIGRGPGESGVFARPTSDGRRIALLDGRGRTTRTLGAGAGLIAATKRADSAPVWVITGTDGAGISTAAAAFQEGALAGRFAIALDQGRPIALPEQSR
jgi:hypothetical protein